MAMAPRIEGRIGRADRTHRSRRRTDGAGPPAACAAGAAPGGRFADRLLQCRYELKYRVTAAKAAAIERFIRPYIQLDHYCKHRPDGAYPVVTLYLDSADFHLARQSLEGQKNRFKLRIRSYTDDPDYPRFVEIKRRLNAVIIKSRARVSQTHLPRVLSGLSVPAETYRSELDTIRQFQLYTTSINAAPVMKVRYLRRAYEGDTENRVRITFDYDLTWRVDHSLQLDSGGPGWLRDAPGTVVLEIKFTGRYPLWLSRMAAYFNLRQQSISKYVHAVKSCCRFGLARPAFAGNV